MKIRMTWLAMSLVLAGAVGSVGCGEVERTYDCAQICTAYADCIDDNVDTTECTDRCEDQGQEDPDFAEQADDCEECLDGEECTDATVECATSCAWVVAEST